MEFLFGLLHGIVVGAIIAFYLHDKFLRNRGIDVETLKRGKMYRVEELEPPQLEATEEEG